jgi:bis(5'-nucleosyl)-tetraphosphatase (symmetrical)
MRWVVGDIHGCAGKLEALLRAIRFDPDRDELWSIGDLVNKGPDSLATLRLWVDLGARGVLGNHDLYALRVHAGCRKRRRDTLDDLLEAPDVEELLAIVRVLPLLARLPGPAREDTWLVHAGLHPGWSDLDAVAGEVNRPPHDDAWLLSPATAFATKARCCTPSGEIDDDVGPPADCAPPYRPWDAYYGGSARILHGHWATRGHHRSGRVIGLDSGCVYGGKLTAWCQEEDRVVQV